MIDLNPHHLETVKRILAEHLPDCEVRAFGSRATWTAWEYSDLDLAVVSPEPLDWKVRSSVREAFEESDLPIRVDVVDWESLSNGFRQTIEGDCVVLQEAATSSGWRETTLGEVIHINPKRSLKRGSEAPFVAMADVLEHQRQLPKLGTREFKGSGSRFSNGDTLLARITPCLENGKTAWVSGLADDEIGHGSTEFIVLSAKEGVTDPRFVYYLARHPKFRSYAIGQMTGTSGRQRVPVSAVESYELALPPLDEQRRIARILGALDDKIELNRRISQTLEAIAQTLFKSWFVDFDPVQAKAQGQPTNLPPQIDALFPNSFQDSELGEIPEGWEVGELADVIEVNPRRTIKRGQLAKHVAMAALPTSGAQVTTWTRRAFTSGSRFTRGDTLLARITPSLENGKTALVDFLDEGEVGWGSTEFIVLRPKGPWPPEFGYLLAREPRFREHAIVNMTGTSGRQRVPPEAVSTYPLTIAPASVATAFRDLVRPWFAFATTAAKQIKTFTAIRDAQLHSLIG